jgi:hypothetical protein
VSLPPGTVQETGALFITNRNEALWGGKSNTVGSFGVRISFRQSFRAALNLSLCWYPRILIRMFHIGSRHARRHTSIRSVLVGGIFSLWNQSLPQPESRSNSEAARTTKPSKFVVQMLRNSPTSAKRHISRYPTCGPAFRIQGSKKRRRSSAIGRHFSMK